MDALNTLIPSPSNTSIFSPNIVIICSAFTTFVSPDDMCDGAIHGHVVTIYGNHNIFFIFNDFRFLLSLRVALILTWSVAVLL